jgi:hypothetical protein
MKRYNNKLLTGILLGLLGVFLLTKLFYSSKSNSNISKEFAALDTANISEVKIYINKTKADLRLTRSDSGWITNSANAQAWADPEEIQELLKSVKQVRIDHLIASEKNSWVDLFVSDTLGVHIIISGKKKVIANWHIGNPPNSASTYIRSDDEDKVYVLENNQMNSLVNKPFDSWRDKRLIKFDKEMITKIIFTYPGDSSFTILKKDSTWTTGQDEIKPSLIDHYLNTVYNQKLFSLAPDSLSKNLPDATVEFWVKDTSVSAIKGWRHNTNWIVSSSYQSTNCFFITESTMKNDILLGRDRLKNNYY